MSILLNLSSDDRKINDTTDSFTIDFNPPISIPDKWSMGLESLSIWYSWYNISPDYGNHIFRYYNGTSWKDITITPGLYTIDDLNHFLQLAMKGNNDSGTDVNNNDVFYITIAPNYNTFKLGIFISNSYQVDLTVGNLHVLFGFDPIVVTASVEGAHNVNITNGVNRILVHVDCITGSYKGTSSSDVIYTFNADGPPSSLLQIKPFRIIYLPLKATGYLFGLRVYITDQLNRRLNLNSEEVSLSLHLKPAS